ncbi:MAG TPA: glycerophosphodiester phosphodiesterase family protein [Thermotogota bacterium]|nr:glycerophosphodiester phosphodiesterase family protein [Thermotogota bacterium]HPJ88579.1 glycerophosphodiester phosphodiesterase family protein [Thermotogota bacterium]
MIAILILAHRGTGKGSGENSINAFDKGLSEKADGLELDIRITKDRIPVCVHDETLTRVFDRELFVRDLSMSDLESLKLYNPDNICTLEDVFKWFGNEIYYDIEIKDPAVLPEFKELVQQYHPKQLMVSSFVHKCLNNVKEAIPEAGIAPLIDFKTIDDYQAYIMDIVRTYSPYSLNLDVRFFEEDNQEKLDWFNDMKTNYNVKLAFWTVNTMNAFKSIESICDFLITDKPSNFRGVVE